MIRRLSLIAVMIAVTAPRLDAQEPTRPAAKQVPSQPAATAVDRSADGLAIKSLMDSFVKAFEAGNAEAAAATYAKDALVVDEQGERFEGRPAIRERYKEAFADDPGSKIAIEVDSLRFLGPDTAIEEGRTTITPATGAPEITRFTAVYVKEGGQWRQAAVRDEVAHDVTPHDRLRELEWLIGDWVNESQDAFVLTTCKWANGGNFLDREFTVKTSGQAVVTGTQRIGWDPLKRQFKIWTFDSDGGHSEGYFTRIGNRWILKVEGVGQDGQPSSATNTITRLGKDRMSWQSNNRTLGGAASPEIEEFVIVRKPPEAGK